MSVGEKQVEREREREGEKGNERERERTFRRHSMVNMNTYYKQLLKSQSIIQY
jgi:hypothetical protein